MPDPQRPKLDMTTEQVEQDAMTAAPHWRWCRYTTDVRAEVVFIGWGYTVRSLFLSGPFTLRDHAHFWPDARWSALILEPE
jgi:hypothetical protein